MAEEEGVDPAPRGTKLTAVERYAKRAVEYATDAEVQNMTLDTFLSTFKSDGSRWSIDRVVPVVSPFYSPHPKGKFYAQYCRKMLILHRPWHNDYRTLWPKDAQGNPKPDEELSAWFVETWHEMLRSEPRLSSYKSCAPFRFALCSLPLQSHPRSAISLPHRIFRYLEACALDKIDPNGENLDNPVPGDGIGDSEDDEDGGDGSNTFRREIPDWMEASGITNRAVADPDDAAAELPTYNPATDAVVKFTADQVSSLRKALLNKRKEHERLLQEGKQGLLPQRQTVSYDDLGTPENRFALLQVLRMLRVMQDATAKGLPYPVDEQSAMFITGPAGVGKSFLIDAIITLVRQHTDFDAKVFTYQGVAAVSCGAYTISSFFGIPAFVGSTLDELSSGPFLRSSSLLRLPPSDPYRPEA